MKTLKILLFMLLLCASNMVAQTPTDSMPHQLTEADFLIKVMDFRNNPQQWVFLGQRPCIIDYYTTWCRPCKQLAPILEELAREYAGQIDIYKIDIDKERTLAALFQVQSIPTLLFCPLGQNPQMVKGLLPKETLCEVIEQLLLPSIPQKQ